MNQRQAISQNYRGRDYPNFKMPPKQCEQVGCESPATWVAEAEQGNWYLCDACSAKQDVTRIVALKLA